MENNVGSIHWMHGLQEYFTFMGETKIADLCSDFLKVLYSENKAHTLRNVCTESMPEKIDKLSVYNLLNFFAHTANSQDNMKLDEISSALSVLFADESVLKTISKFYRETEYDLSDAFSRGQVQSKIWLTEELAKVGTNYDVVYHLGGWYGQLTWYFKNRIEFTKYRNFDIDPAACKVSDSIVNLQYLDGYKVKAVEIGLPMKSSTDEEKNMAWIARTGCEYPIKNFGTGAEFKEKTQPDLIINTSAEHMPSIWFDKFVNRPQTTDPLFVIQSNNLFDAEGHVNCVHSIEHMLKKFPLSRLEYGGEIQLTGYKRFMVIGRP